MESKLGLQHLPCNDSKRIDVGLAPRLVVKLPLFEVKKLWRSVAHRAIDILTGGAPVACHLGSMRSSRSGGAKQEYVLRPQVAVHDASAVNETHSVTDINADLKNLRGRRTRSLIDMICILRLQVAVRRQLHDDPVRIVNFKEGIHNDETFMNHRCVYELELGKQLLNLLLVKALREFLQGDVLRSPEAASKIAR